MKAILLTAFAFGLLFLLAGHAKAQVRIDEPGVPKLFTPKKEECTKKDGSCAAGSDKCACPACPGGSCQVSKVKVTQRIRSVEIVGVPVVSRIVAFIRKVLHPREARVVMQVESGQRFPVMHRLTHPLGGRRCR